MYLIRGYCHRQDEGCLAAHSFQIDLSPAIPDMVARSGIDQAAVNRKIGTCGEYWLDASGYTDPFEYEGKVRRLWEANCIRVRWGEWGPEHISVPGNACGLDLSDCFGCAFKGGKSLFPHNLDGPMQKYLLTIVFTEFMEDIVILGRTEERSICCEDKQKNQGS